MRRKTLPKRRINLKKPMYILLLTTIISAIVSMAKFGQAIEGNNDAIVALPIFSTTTIDLENIYPSMETKKYQLLIKNTEDSKTSQVSLKYVIRANSIGNVPLNIEIYRKENNEIVGDNLLINGVTNEISMGVEETTNNYELRISWDNSDPSYSSYEYSGETSYVEIKAEAVQKD